jgi:hypothetical protein
LGLYCGLLPLSAGSAVGGISTTGATGLTSLKFMASSGGASKFSVSCVSATFFSIEIQHHHLFAFYKNNFISIKPIKIVVIDVLAVPLFPFPERIKILVLGKIPIRFPFRSFISRSIVVIHMSIRQAIPEHFISHNPCIMEDVFFAAM